MSLRRGLAGAWVACAVMVFAAGCGSSDKGGSSSAGSGSSTSIASSGGTKAKIAFLGYVDGGVPQSEIAGAREVADSVKQFTANFDPQKQNQQCVDAIQSRRYNAIMLAPVDPTSAKPCVTAAKAAKIPVVTMDFPVGNDVNSPEPQVDGVVGSVVWPYSSNADAVAALVKQACDGKSPCKVILSVATPTDRFTNDIGPAITKNVPGAKLVQKIVTSYDASLIPKTLPDALTAHRDARVVVLTADNLAVAALDVVKRAGLAGKVAIIGNGGSTEGAALVRDGKLFGTTGNWPRQAGELAAKMLNDAVNGRKIAQPGVDQFKIDQPLLVTKETVGQFKPEWR